MLSDHYFERMHIRHNNGMPCLRKNSNDVYKILEKNFKEIMPLKRKFCGKEGRLRVGLDRGTTLGSVGIPLPDSPVSPIPCHNLLPRISAHFCAEVNIITTNSKKGIKPNRLTPQN